jgi:hypothetical protein
MRARSWMAALALIAGTGMFVGRGLPSLGRSTTPTQEQEETPAAKQAEPKAARKDESRELDPQPSAIQLKLAIAGLGRAGCDVEVKPGNASCRFRVLNVTEQGEAFKKGVDGPQHVSSTGYAYMELRDIQLRGADKICTVAITVREPGQSTRTVYRGFPLKPKAEPGTGTSAPAGKPPVFTCYLNAPSKIARLEQPTTRK